MIDNRKQFAITVLFNEQRQTISLKKKFAIL